MKNVLTLLLLLVVKVHAYTLYSPIYQLKNVGGTVVAEFPMQNYVYSNEYSFYHSTTGLNMRVIADGPNIIKGYEVLSGEMKWCKEFNVDQTGPGNQVPLDIYATSITTPHLIAVSGDRYVVNINANIGTVMGYADYRAGPEGVVIGGSQVTTYEQGTITSTSCMDSDSDRAFDIRSQEFVFMPSNGYFRIDKDLGNGTFFKLEGSAISPSRRAAEFVRGEYTASGKRIYAPVIPIGEYQAGVIASPEYDLIFDEILSVATPVSIVKMNNAGPGLGFSIVQQTVECRFAAEFESEEGNCTRGSITATPSESSILGLFSAAETALSISTFNFIPGAGVFVNNASEWATTGLLDRGLGLDLYHIWLEEFDDRFAPTRVTDQQDLMDYFMFNNF